MAVVSARGSPNSFPSPRLPPSPQPRPDAERMFMRGGSSRSTGTSGSLRSASLRDIDEEAAVVVADDDGGGGKLYVAVGKDQKDGKSNVSAAQSLGLVGGDLKLVLLHVHQPADRIMNGKQQTINFILFVCLISSPCLFSIA